MRLAGFISILLLSLCAGRSSAQLQQYETPYYVMHTDIDPDDAREAAIRTTRMFEEYRERTRDFTGGQISRKLPFYLFRRPEDYYAAGGLPGSAGVFNGSRLMAIAGEKVGRGTWHVVQHEGFHQFARAIIRGRIPPWANEGMADYFAHGVFTGDSFVVGVIPPDRLRRVKREIAEGAMRPLPEMMVLTQAQWNAGLSGVNYDQGWSMVHFLAHGEDGRYQQAFANFFKDLNAGIDWRNAWLNNFGGDVGAFEKRWKDYWLNLPEEPTADLYARATAATLTSFLARAHARKQTFDSFDAFVAAADAGQLQAHGDDWLPPALLADAVAQAKRRGTWSIEPGNRNTRKLVRESDEETTWVGHFTVAGGRVGRVWIEMPEKPVSSAAKPERESAAVSPAVAPPPAAPPPPPRITPTTRPRTDPLVSAMSLARSYGRAGDNAKARATLEKALKENPDSPALKEAKALLAELK